jgi:neutral ceramidase
MKAVFQYLTVLLLFITAGCTAMRQTHLPDNTPDQLAAGMAEIDITPPAGHRMAGYFDERLATGTHDPLKAKAIIIQQGDEKVAFVFCDLVGLSLNVTTNARAIASQQTGIPVSHIVIAATHSHTGPLFDDVRRDYFHKTAVEKYGSDPQEKIYYPEFLTERLVKVINRANSHLTPAELDAGIAQVQDLPFNRRYHMKNGRVATNPGQLNTNIVSAAGPVDHDVSILEVKNLKRNKTIGGLTVFAMHADTVGGGLWSADYPFYIQENLRKAFGADYISAFGAGTCGDLNQVNIAVKEPFKGQEIAEKLGTKISDTVLSAQKDLAPIVHPSLAVKGITLHLTLQEVTPKELAEARQNITRLRDESLDFYAKVRTVKALDLEARGTKTWPMEVQVFCLDSDTAIVCLPAEIFVELGLSIKKASPFKKTIVISICNDRPCYIPTENAFKEGSYEVTNSRLASGSGEALVEAAVKLLNELKN